MHNNIQIKLDQWVVSFVTTSASCLLWPILPPAYSLPVVLISACLILRYSNGHWLSGALFGLLWMASVGHWQLNWQLPSSQIRRITLVQGQVESITSSGPVQRFNLAIKEAEIDGTKKHFWLPPIVRLSWQKPDFKVKQGMLISLSVRLKPVHGLGNQGGFDYLHWLRASGIQATGYVKQQEINHVNNPYYSVRQRLTDRLASSELDNFPWIAALSVGYKGGFSQTDWQVIQQNGIAHLVAISGLHLGILAMWAFAICRVFIRVLVYVFPISQTYNLRIVSMCCCALLVAYYSYLAGFSLPTKRALIVFLLVCCLHLIGKHWQMTKKLLYCAFMVILIDPLSLLSGSFWLSFCAVLVIVFYLWRWPEKQADKTSLVVSRIGRRLKQMALLQWTISLLMIPLSIGLFQYLPIWGALVNLVAIPFVSLVLVPLCLLCVSAMLLELDIYLPLLVLTDGLLSGSIALLANNPAGGFQTPELPPLVLLSLLLAVTAFTWSREYTTKLLSLCLLLPALSYYLPARPQHWEVNVLDVGQGLAVVIVSRGRAFVYDVGGRYPSGFNMADAVIVPFLQARHIQQIDWLVVSHFDNDHAGALPVLKQAVRINETISSKDRCHQGWHIRWQNLNIKSVWPQGANSVSDNDTSCVLVVSDGVHRALLPGDISKQVEQQLLLTQGEQIRADLLIAPHHGSNSSSSDAFIDAVAPQIVIFSQGYMNRWNFPAQKVVNRYVKTGSDLYATGDTGQVQVVIPYPEQQEDNKLKAGKLSVKTFRQDIKPYWYSR